MASKAIWEVDPETRSKVRDLVVSHMAMAPEAQQFTRSYHRFGEAKTWTHRIRLTVPVSLPQLLAIQKDAANSICCDCAAPSPQWASPKFGIFICLSCAGVHRGLGVHISFVRSISMDAFKAGEIERMRLGGNAAWRAFFEAHDETQMRGLTWDDATIADRYSGEAGEEYKERLAAKVEGREYEPGEKKEATAGRAQQNASPSAAPTRSGPRAKTGGLGVGAPAGSGAGAAAGNGKVKVDDKYFARLGADNAGRPADLPPSQGGKYAGFGNTPMPPAGSREEQALPNLDELQKDPLTALSKGFGWFTSTVTKTAKTVNSDFIQPTAKQVCCPHPEHLPRIPCRV